MGGGGGGMGVRGVRGGEAPGGAVVAAAAGGGALRAAGDQGPPVPLLHRLRPRDGGAHGRRLRQANAAPLPLPQRPPARPRLLPPLEENLRYASDMLSPCMAFCLSVLVSCFGLSLHTLFLFSTYSPSFSVLPFFYFIVFSPLCMVAVPCGFVAKTLLALSDRMH